MSRFGTFHVKKSDYSKNTIDEIYPIENGHLLKLYDGDKVKYNLNSDKIAIDIELIESNSKFRKTKIPVIIDITALKRYGYTKKNVPIYLAKPHNPQLPKLFVSTRIKKKLKPPYKNQLAIVKIIEWIDEYPKAKVVNILGDVDNNEVYYHYLVYCHNLYNKKTKLPKTLDFDIDSFDLSGYIDKTDANIFSIDPKGTLDIDDALEINKIDTDTYDITVYIADPTAFIKHYNNSEFNKTILNKLQTVYSIDRNYPMLPTEFSENLCSLLYGKRRLALALSLKVTETGEILENTLRFQKTIIVNKMSISYKKAQSKIETSIIKNNPLKLLYTISQKIAKLNYPKIWKKSWDTHRMIETMMVMANHHSAKFLKQFSETLPTKPIIRYHDIPDYLPPSTLSQDLMENINKFYLKSALYSTNLTQTNHYGLGLDIYTHYTSPIRRFTDLYTHFLIKHIVFGEEVPEDFKLTSSIETNFIEKLNTNYKNSRRLALDLERFTVIEKISNLPDRMIHTKAIILDFWDDGVILYIPELKLKIFHKLINDTLEDLFEIVIDKKSMEISVIDKKTTKTTWKSKKYNEIDIEIYQVTNDNLKFRLISKIL